MKSYVLFETRIERKDTRTPKEKLLAILPKYAKERLSDITEEIGLIDDCKYLVRWTNQYTDGLNDGVGASFPVHSIREAKEFLCGSIYKVGE